LVASGLAIIFIEVWRGDQADALGYSAGLALVGLGITGRLQAWALAGGDESKQIDAHRDDLRTEAREDREESG